VETPQCHEVAEPGAKLQARQTLKTTLLQTEFQHRAGALDMSIHGAKIKTSTHL
jgi:hypothetical protein